MKASANLEGLRLQRNGIGDQGTEALAEAVRASADLEKLLLK